MTCATETRVRRIHSRTRQYRARYEARLLSCLAACCLLLLAGIGLLLRSVQSPGVPGISGAVLLRDGAGAYIVVGLLAFVLGVAATVLCERQTVQTVCKKARTKGA